MFIMLHGRELRDFRQTKRLLSERSKGRNHMRWKFAYPHVAYDTFP